MSKIATWKWNIHFVVELGDTDLAESQADKGSGGSSVTWEEMSRNQWKRVFRVQQDRTDAHWNTWSFRFGIWIALMTRPVAQLLRGTTNSMAVMMNTTERGQTALTRPPCSVGRKRASASHDGGKAACVLAIFWSSEDSWC